MAKTSRFAYQKTSKNNVKTIANPIDKSRKRDMFMMSKDNILGFGYAHGYIKESPEMEFCIYC